jgi:drug/metabolite transporter (DMT)-like permease
VGVLLQKQALRDVDPFTSTWLGCVAGAVVCLPFTPALIHEVVAAPTAAWAYALSHTSAGRLSSSSYLVPGLAVLMSWLLLDEAPAPLALAGGALCLLGVAISRLPSRRPVERAPVSTSVG